MRRGNSDASELKSSPHTHTHKHTNTRGDSEKRVRIAPVFLIPGSGTQSGGTAARAHSQGRRKGQGRGVLRGVSKCWERGGI